MDIPRGKPLKRKTNEAIGHQHKRARDSNANINWDVAGKVHKIVMKNFMCHSAMQITLNQNVNFIIGRNGSGKSAILTALTVGLGAKANVTNRGGNIKEFIKKGETSAMIEVTLTNKGCMAYKPDVYGDFITICRTIGGGARYVIKNAKGNVICRKRHELDQILSALNIQVENPISILNQDVSRTFLVSSSSADKYSLFMKATRLDVIGQNYKEAQMLSEETRERLQEAKGILKTTKEEIDKLERDVRLLESVENMRERYANAKIELEWAKVMKEEKILRVLEKKLKECQEKLTEIQNEGKSDENKQKELDKEIKALIKMLTETSDKVAVHREKYDQEKRRLTTTKEIYSNKVKEWRTAESKVKRTQTEIHTLQQEIHRLENGNTEQDKERKKMQEQLVTMENKLEEIDDRLRTKQTDQMHYETDKVHLEQDENSAKIELERISGRMHKLAKEIHSLKQQSGDSVTIFGPNMPRFIQRIDQEYAAGRFRKKPIGPIGAYIKLKDVSWIPAVEQFLGRRYLTSFCVDNSSDARVLRQIMNEVFSEDDIPDISTTKFFDRVHDVRENCTGSRRYSNLLNAMDISNPVVANTLIDARQIECILLIPTSEEACDIMSHSSKVPANCKQALTRKAETFFPDPNYRTYAGPRTLSKKLLQVSTHQVIQSLEEEMVSVKQEHTVAESLYKEVHIKLQRSINGLKDIKSQVQQLESSKRAIKAKFEVLKDKCEDRETISVTTYREEIQTLERKLEGEKKLEEDLLNEVRQQKKNLSDLENEIQNLEKLVSQVDIELNPIKSKIETLKNEKSMLRVNSQYGEKRLNDARMLVQRATADYDIQERVTEQIIKDAEKVGPRIETTRSVQEVREELKDLKSHIDKVERSMASKEELEEELNEKREKYAGAIVLSERLEKSNNKHLERLRLRRRTFQEMKKVMGERVQNAFSGVLALRKYKGTLTVDHKNKLLELEVRPQDSAKRPTNDAKSLSGGERSYSTVAFILALWECTGLPFYFLDEFDVFMDKVNRKVIMDILLDHTKSHPESQFAFLTPLDTSGILAEDYVTIHQLAPPERAERNN